MTAKMSHFPCNHPVTVELHSPPSQSKPKEAEEEEGNKSFPHVRFASPRAKREKEEDETCTHAGGSREKSKGKNFTTRLLFLSFILLSCPLRKEGEGE